jgi:HEAT repeat protein
VTGRVVSALGISEGEGRLAGWTAALFLVTQSTHGLGANAADTLFFERFGVEELPKMIVLAGLAVMVIVLAHTVGLTSRGERVWLPVVTGASALWVFLVWAGVFIGTTIIYPIIWVSTQGIIMLTLTMMWNAAGAVCTTRQAKRLFPLFATAGVAGGIIGNLATGPIAALLGTQTLLLFQAALLVGSTGLVLRIRDLMRDDTREAAGASVTSRMLQAMRSVLSSRFLKLAAAVAFTTWILFYMVVFPFSEAAAGAFDSEADLAAFLGVFSSIATAATFVVGLLIAKRLFSRIGIVMSLLILPVVYAAGFGVWLIDFGLGAAAAVRGFQWVAVNAIGATAFSALFNVLTGRRRAEIVAFMTAVPAQLGVIAGGVLLIASEGMSRTVQFGIGLAVSIVAVIVVLAMRPAYLDAILSSVKKGLVGVFDVPSPGLLSPVDAEAKRVLRTRLAHESPEARAYALHALARLDDHQGIHDAASHLKDESPLVRARAFDVVCDFDPDGFRKHAEAALADDTPEVRVRALHYAAANGSRDAAKAALNDPDTGVRATAAVIVGGPQGQDVADEILHLGDRRGTRSLLSETIRMGADLDLGFSGLLRDEDPEIRALAAGASATVGSDHSMIQPLLNDPSLRVRRAASEALARTSEGRELLIDILQVGTVNETDAALRALIPFDQLTDDLVEWARSEAERAAKLDRFARALDEKTDSPVARFLHRALSARTERLEQWVLMAMTTVDTEDVMPLVQKGVAARDEETKAQAIEALETVGDRRVLEVLLPLLDRPPGRPDLGEREALRALSADFDPWLRALAVRCLFDGIQSDLDRLRVLARTDDSDLVRDIVPSLGAMPAETTDTLSMMDRVLALQRVAMFSELDPEDLELLARATSEIAYEPQEAVYREGGEGNEVLMIVEGSAVISVEREGQVKVINTYGPGESVGELALLGLGVRSADVTAGEEGLHAVVMTRSDFISVLEERPSVALGMLSTLAERLVEET